MKSISTTPQYKNVAEIQSAINTLNLQQDTAEQKSVAAEQNLAESPTSNTLNPTQSDISTDISRMAANATAEKDALKARRLRWDPTSTSTGDVTTEENAFLNKNADNTPKSWWQKAYDFARKPVGSFFRGMQAPGSAIVGVAKYAVGQGGENSLTQQVAQSAVEGDSWGDVLRKSNVPVLSNNWVAAPLGFAADVAMDPIGWFSAGTEAIVPRLAKGLTEGGLEGASLAARSYAADKVARAKYFNPMNWGAGKSVDQFLNKINTTIGMTDAEKALAHAGLSDRAMALLAAKEKAGTLNEEWYKMIGAADKEGQLTGLIDKLAPNEKAFAAASVARKNITSALGMADETSDQVFKYDPFTNSMKRVEAEAAGEAAKTLANDVANPSFRMKWSSDLADSVQYVSRSVPQTIDEIRQGRHLEGPLGFDPARQTVAEQIIADEKKTYQYIQNLIDNNAVKADGTPWTKQDLHVEAMRLLDDATTGSRNQLSLRVAQDLKKVMTGDPEVAGDMANLILQDPTGTVEWFSNLNFRDAKEFANAWYGLKTNIKSVDSAVARGLKIPVLRKVANALNIYGGLFRSATLSGNIIKTTGSQFISNVANHGLIFEIDKPSYARILGESINMQIFKSNPAIEMLFRTVNGKPTEMTELLMENPKMVEKLFGVPASYLANKQSFYQEIMSRISMQFPTLTPNQQSSISRTMANIKGFGAELEHLQEVIKQKGSGEHAMDLLKAMYEKHGMKLDDSLLKPDNLSDALLASGVWQYGAFNDYVQTGLKLKASAKDADPVTKALSFYVNEMPKWFQTPDNISRLQAFRYMTEGGLSSNEVKKIMRAYKVDIGGIEKIKSVGDKALNTWRVKPRQAAAIADSMIISTQDMPGFVKLMQKMPVIGAPFFSFTYANAYHTANALMANPAAASQFMKLRDEVGGQPTPAETASLTKNQADALMAPEFWRMQFLKDHPTYYNFGNVLPWFATALTEGSQRAWKTETGKTIGSVIDETPIIKEMFKQPGGQYLMDYYLIPALTAAAGQEEAVNKFGGYIWPVNADIYEAIAHRVRGAIEPLVPSVAAEAYLPIDFAAGSPLTGNPDVLDFVPSYTLRSWGNNFQGRTASGFDTTKDRAELIGNRILSGTTGIQAIQPYISTNQKDYADTTSTQ